MWELWRMAQDLGVRPSAVAGIDSRFAAAFYFDRALWTFAKVIEDEQEKAVSRLPTSAKEKAHVRARQKVLDRFLNTEPTAEAGRFRSPG